MVDEAKAFCPECGNPFVAEETRSEQTEHDRFDGTMMLSKSNYNIMLSEMELDITEQPAAKGERTVPADRPVAGMPAGNSSRFAFIIIGAVLLLMVIFYIFFVGQPFSK